MGKYFIDAFWWIWIPVEDDKSFGSAWLPARHRVWSPFTAPCSYQNSTVCLSNDFTSTTTQFVLSQGYLRHCFHRQHASSRAMDSGAGVRFVVVGRSENTDSCGAASNGLGPGGFLHFWITVEKATVASCWKRGQQEFAPYCRKVCWDLRTLQCNWTKARSSKNFRVTLKFSSLRDHTRPPRLSSALAMVLTMNAHRNQRTHLLSDADSIAHSSSLLILVTSQHLNIWNYRHGKTFPVSNFIDFSVCAFRLAISLQTPSQIWHEAGMCQSVREKQ